MPMHRKTSGNAENLRRRLPHLQNLAFLEVAVQGKKAEDTRDYSKFQEYYKKAKELYQEQLSSNANDMEMDRMDDLYQQAVQSGWIS